MKNTKTAFLKKFKKINQLFWGIFFLFQKHKKERFFIKKNIFLENAKKQFFFKNTKKRKTLKSIFLKLIKSDFVPKI